MEFSTPNVSIRRDLVGIRLDNWNALLQLLTLIHLSPRLDEFRWNLKESGKFSVDSMYKTLIQPSKW
jgi:hypothetical protein